MKALTWLKTAVLSDTGMTSAISVHTIAPAMDPPPPMRTKTQPGKVAQMENVSGKYTIAQISLLQSREVCKFNAYKLSLSRLSEEYSQIMRGKVLGDDRICPQ